MSLATSTAMTEAAQPMPDRLTVRMLGLNLKCRTTAADREGVGLKAVQLTIRPSTCMHGTPLISAQCAQQRKAHCCPKFYFAATHLRLGRVCC